MRRVNRMRIQNANSRTRLLITADKNDINKITDDW